MNQDLKSRIPSAILYVLFIATLTLCGPWTTVILLLVFCGLSLQEFVHGNYGSQSGKTNYIYGLSILIMVSSVTSVFEYIDTSLLIVLSSLIFTFNIVYLIFKKTSLLTRPPTMAVILFYILLPFIVGIRMVLTVEGYTLILLGTFIIVWLNDAGAYFIGKQFGRTKLFPSISPSKTWEGLIGGGLAGIIVSTILSAILNIYNVKTWLVLAFIIWIAGTFGDLVESSWKRHHGLKDSGTLMKGHGGFLDRLDSFIYAIPFVSLYIVFIIQNS